MQSTLSPQVYRAKGALNIALRQSERDSPHFRAVSPQVSSAGAHETLPCGKAKGTNCDGSRPLCPAQKRDTLVGASFFGGREWARTIDLLRVKQAL